MKLRYFKIFDLERVEIQSIKWMIFFQFDWKNQKEKVTNHEEMY